MLQNIVLGLSAETTTGTGYFFGYFGVACALILASNLVIINKKIWERLMEQLKVALVSVAWVSSSLTS